MIFDGLMRVYSTCRDCHQLMQVTSYGDTVHPSCNERPRRVETLTRQWVRHVESGDLARENEAAMEIAQIDSQPPKLGAAAEYYARWGWPVFPLRARDKRPAIRGGKGLHDATTDVQQIRRWWNAHPDDNIGLPTGSVFDVLDVDPRHGGAQSFLDLLHSGALTVCHGISSTASGGMHVLFKAAGQGNSTNLGGYSGIDWRGGGGYIVAPPSTLGEPGRSWVWSVVPSPVVKNVAGVRK